MEYCWVDNKKAYYELKNAFEFAGISYEISTERLITKNSRFVGTKIWLFHIHPSFRDKVDRLIAEHNDIISTEPCISKYVNVSDKLPNGFKKIYYVYYIIMILLLVMTFVSGYLGYYSWARISFFVSYMSIMFFGWNYSKKHPFGILLFMLYESGSVVYLTGAAYTTENILNYIGHNYTVGDFPIFILSLIRNDWIGLFPGLLIILMIISFLILAWRGLRRYRVNPLAEKWGYMIVVFACYMIIMITTIICYEKVFNCYYEDVYDNYAGMTRDSNAEEKRNEAQKTIKVTRGDYTLLCTYYRIEGTDSYEMYPYEILLENVDGDIYCIEPAYKNQYDPDALSGFKYSLATYLGVDYGEVVPVAEIIKDQTLSEHFISYFMNIAIISMILMIMQLFFDNNIKNSIFDTKRKGILN